MSNLNNDFDSFFNLEDDTPISNSSAQQAFPAPSYQYGDLRQQTGLPMGGLADTFARNQASGLHYRPSNTGFVMPTETLNLPLTNLDEFDFNRSQFDMDLETDSPSDLPAMFYPGGSQLVSPSTQTPQRIYPGMHTQQAAQAKAKAQEMQKQQSQPKHLQGQRSLPSQTPKAPAAKDPHVEESISRLLSRMRQSSTVSSNEDDDANTLSGMSNMPRLKKDEDDMDEDERLLNSEEGKKLSSKERRQLRNKVSARAFRSRRKEYITQLESELAGKVQEANDLRIQNRQLMEENTRLTDLTRMLLSSQAFSGFLQELSASGGSAAAHSFQQAQQQLRPQVQQQQQQSPSVPKDISSHEAARQLQSQSSQMHVGMTLIPEVNFDMMDPTSWNAVPSNDFQVFAVTELPEPPKIDLDMLSGKNTTSSQSSKQAPTLPRLPSIKSDVKSTTQVDETVELDETEFDLYFSTKSTATVPLNLPISLSLQLSKAALSSELLSMVSVDTENIDPAEALSNMCEALDESCSKLSNFLPN